MVFQGSRAPRPDKTPSQTGVSSVAQFLLASCAIIILWEVLYLQNAVESVMLLPAWGFAVICSSCTVQHGAGACEVDHHQQQDTHEHQRALDKMR